MVKDYITTREYADLHGLPIETVRTRVKQNKIPFIKVGDSIMIDRKTPWETRQVGRPRKDAQQPKVDSRKLKVRTTRAYYVTVEDSTGKEVASDFTFLSKAEAEKLGAKMKREIEARGNQ